MRFPTIGRDTSGMALSEQLRQAIRDSGKSLLLIARESGTTQPSLYQFMAGNDIRLGTAEKLADYFGLNLNRGSSHESHQGQKTRKKKASATRRKSAK